MGPPARGEMGLQNNSTNDRGTGAFWPMKSLQNGLN
jgi:hypothetical protein